MTTRVLPYQSASNSARALSEAIGCRRMKLRGSSLPDTSALTIINWGNRSTDLSGYRQATVLNRDLTKAANKREFFRTVEAYNHLIAESDALQVSLPPSTTEQSVAQGWLNDGKSVVCRHELCGHSGEGIELVEPVDGSPAQVPSAPLYTMYTKKRDEYRVHVVMGVVTDVQRKARNSDVAEADVNWKIRNHGNGFVFVRGGVTPPQCVLDNALATMTALELDFGAVDIIHQPRSDRAYVLEVNTACGLEGTTLDRYSAALSAAVLGVAPACYDTHEDVVVAEAVESTQPRFNVGDIIETVRHEGFHGRVDVYWEVVSVEDGFVRVKVFQPSCAGSTNIFTVDNNQATLTTDFDGVNYLDNLYLRVRARLAEQDSVRRVRVNIAGLHISTLVDVSVINGNIQKLFSAPEKYSIQKRGVARGAATIPATLQFTREVDVNV